MTDLGADLAASLDPAVVARRCGFQPDPWQVEAMRSPARQALWLVARQLGKSTTAALVAAHTALFTPGSLVLLVSPSQRQSVELLHKTRAVITQIETPMRLQETKLELASGSRVVSLPGAEGTIRGFSADLVVIDEAARVEDATYAAVRPMLAVTGGRMLALSTPHGARGWFWEAWTLGEGWERTMVRATDCPRISTEFLAGERQAMSHHSFSSEYLCEFSALVNAAFDPADIERAFT